MIDLRAQEWLSRLQGNGPKLASLGLAALIGVEMVRVMVSTFGGGPVRSPQPVMANTAARAPRAGFDPKASFLPTFRCCPGGFRSRPDNIPSPLQIWCWQELLQPPTPSAAWPSSAMAARPRCTRLATMSAAPTSLSIPRPCHSRPRRGVETLPLPRLLGPGMHAPPRRASNRRRFAYCGGRRGHSTPGAAGSRSIGSSHAHSTLLRQRGRKASGLSCLSGSKSADIQQAGAAARRFGDCDQWHRTR